MLVELAESFTALYHFLWGLWQSPRRWHSGHPVLPVQEVHLPEKETSAHSSLQLLPARLALKLVETLSKPGHVVPSWLHGTETVPGSWEREVATPRPPAWEGCCFSTLGIHRRAWGARRFPRCSPCCVLWRLGGFKDRSVSLWCCESMCQRCGRTPSVRAPTLQQM